MNILFFTNAMKGRYGYSVVGEKIAKALRDTGHLVHYFSMQGLYPPFKEDGIVQLGLRYDAFGSDMMANYIKAYDIDILLTMFDVWVEQAQYIPQVVQQFKVPWICHVTINCTPVSPYLAQPLKAASALVAPSVFSADELRKVGFSNVFYIPHGVDTSVFRPLPQQMKDEMKRRLGIENKEFVILTVMRNRLGKNYPALFYAWKLLLQTMPELAQKGVLVILTDPIEITPMSPGMRLDLLRQIMGLQDYIKFVWARPSKERDKVIMTYEGDPKGFMHNANCNFDEYEMAKLYNIADVHVIPSQGESFCLPALESMACGVPQIAVDFTSGPELVGQPGTGLLAKVQAMHTNQILSDNAIVDPVDLAECIKKMYLDRNLRAECSRKAVAFAQTLEWSRVMPAWLELFKKIEEMMMRVDYPNFRLGV